MPHKKGFPPPLHFFHLRYLKTANQALTFSNGQMDEVQISQQPLLAF